MATQADYNNDKIAFMSGHEIREEAHNEGRTFKKVYIRDDGERFYEYMQRDVEVIKTLNFYPTHWTYRTRACGDRVEWFSSINSASKFYTEVY